MEPRFGHDFSQVRIHTGGQAASSAQAVNALAYTAGSHIVFGTGQYAPHTTSGKALLAHELSHVLQQSTGAVQRLTQISQPGDASEQQADRVAEQVMHMQEATLPDGRKDGPQEVTHETPEDYARRPTIQRQAEEGGPEEEGIEVGEQLMILPRWRIMTLPETSVVQRQPAVPATSGCDIPTTMRKVTAGKFEGGKKLDDYYPDLVGAGVWGSSDTAGTFDTGKRAGSAVQLIGEYPSPCAAGGSVFTLGQTATIVRAKADGKKLMEGGKALEGQTLDDIKRSRRDASKAPFRQEFNFAVSMADPISGIPYNTLKSYELEVNLTSSLTGPGGSKSVNWGITIEASGGTVTKNELR